MWDFYFGSIGQQWFQTSEDSGRVLWKLFRLFGDLTVNSGQRRLVQVLSAKSKAPVFNYIFNASHDQFHKYLEERMTSLEKSFGKINLKAYKLHGTLLFGILENTPGTYPIPSTFAERGFHSTEVPPWKELYYLFEPLDQPEFPPMANTSIEIPLHSLNNPFRRNLTLEEESLSDFLVRLWVSFAKYGSPKQAVGSSGRGGEGRWTRASTTDGSLNYFVLGVKSYPLRGDFRKAVSCTCVIIGSTII